MADKKTNPVKTVEQWQEEIKLRQTELIEFNVILKDLEKQVRGKLWLWFLLPVFGIVIYFSMYNKRKENDEYGPAFMNIKTEIANNELRIMIAQREIEKLTK